MSSKKLIAITCLPVSLMLAGQLLAIEPPDRPVAPPPTPTPLPKQEATPAQPVPRGLVKPQPEAMPMAPQAKKAVRTYLGVGTCLVPKMLSIHLGLPENAGVIVRSLDPEGPAAKAGVAEYDIIKSINGKAVAAHDDLCGIVCGQKPGDEVTLDLIHEGKPATAKVKLGERPEADLAMGRPQPLDNLLEGIQGEQADRIRKAIEQNLRGMERELGQHAEEAAPHVDRAMRDMQQRAEKLLDDAQPKKGKGMFNMSSESSIRMLDGQGSIELKSKDGGKEVIVRDPSGKEVWSGPWDTEQDKAAAPADVRERVGKLKIDMSGGGHTFRLKLGGRAGIQDGDAGVDD